MLQGEHSAILSTVFKLSFVVKIFVLSILVAVLHRFYCSLKGLDKIPHKTAFHVSSGPVLFAKIKLLFGDRSTICLEIIACDISIYTMDHPDLIVCCLMENSIGLKRANL